MISTQSASFFGLSVVLTFFLNQRATHFKVEELDASANDEKLKENLIQFYNQNTFEGYSSDSLDFIIESPRLRNAGRGWPLYLSSLTTGELLQQKEKWSIVSILGIKGSGKSFLLNRLHEAISNHYQSNAESISNLNYNLDGGIRGYFIPSDTNGTLLMKMVGSISPWDRYHLFDKAEKVSKIEDALDEQALDERYLEDIAIDVSNTIFYVVDHLTRENQEAILRLIQQLSSRHDEDKRLIIVHNFKHFSPEEAEDLVKEQVRKAFRAGKHPFDTHNTFISHYSIGNADPRLKGYLHVQHVVLFDDKSSPGHESNQQVLKILLNSEMIGRPVNRSLLKESPSERISTAMARQLPKYVLESSCCAADEDWAKPEEDYVLVPKIHASAFLKVKGISSGRPFALINHEPVAEPRRLLSRVDYSPRYACYESKNNDRFSIRIDLPGVPSSSLTISPRSEPIEGTDPFVHVAWDRSRYEEYRIIVSGRRRLPDEFPAIPSTPFRIVVPVSYRFNKETKITFENNILWISIGAVVVD